MEYIIVFIEGIITFVSPCILPMLPIYIAYFAGGEEKEGSSRKVIANAMGFVIGFTLIFTLLGTAAGSIGEVLKANSSLISRLGGIVLILFGLNYMEVLKIGFLQQTKRIGVKVRPIKFISSVLFGFIFAFGWTPCIGTFLGSALMLAASSVSSSKGALMLLMYSCGLGLPFIFSALLINQFKSTFDWIKKHYRVINLSSGIILIVIGLAMITGYFNALLALFQIG